MGLCFVGIPERLDSIFEEANLHGQWKVCVADKHYQFRAENGGVMNWYPRTGTLSFGGKEPGKSQLQRYVKRVLSAATMSSGGYSSLASAMQP